MVCYLFGVKLFSEVMLLHCYLEQWENIGDFESKYSTSIHKSEFDKDMTNKS